VFYPLKATSEKRKPFPVPASLKMIRLFTAKSNLRKIFIPFLIVFARHQLKSIKIKKSIKINKLISLNSLVILS